jgi:hypothetical protein
MSASVWNKHKTLPVCFTPDADCDPKRRANEKTRLQKPEAMPLSAAAHPVEAPAF